MEIYNEQMQRVEAPDLTRGWLEETKKTVHHAAIEEIPEIWHYEVEAEYANGGRDVRRVIDRAGRKAREAWEEEIEIRVYHPYTKEELERMKQEAERPTLQERMENMEAELQAISERIDTMVMRMADVLEMKGGK